MDPPPHYPSTPAWNITLTHCWNKLTIHQPSRNLWFWTIKWSMAFISKQSCHFLISVFLSLLLLFVSFSYVGSKVSSDNCLLIPVLNICSRSAPIDPILEVLFIKFHFTLHTKRETTSLPLYNAIKVTNQSILLIPLWTQPQLQTSSCLYSS